MKILITLILVCSMAGVVLNAQLVVSVPTLEALEIEKRIDRAQRWLATTQQWVEEAARVEQQIRLLEKQLRTASPNIFALTNAAVEITSNNRNNHITALINSQLHAAYMRVGEITAEKIAENEKVINTIFDRLQTINNNVATRASILKRLRDLSQGSQSVLEQSQYTMQVMEQIVDGINDTNIILNGQAQILAVERAAEQALQKARDDLWERIEIYTGNPVDVQNYKRQLYNTIRSKKWRWIK